MQAYPVEHDFVTQGVSVIRLAAIYFAMVFSIGFVLGTLRVIVLVPKLGTRISELIELPLMVLAVYIVGRWIAHQTISSRQALQTGMLALAFLLVAEVLLGALLFGKSPIESLFHKDPISGTAYYLSLLVFAMVPWYVRGKMTRARHVD